MPKLKIRGESNQTIQEDVENFVNESIGSALCPPVPFRVREKYIIRTITMINIGRLVDITGHFLTLDDASWIADAGRWEECITKPEGIKISEKFKDPVIINVQCIVDATKWRLALPKESISR